MQSLLEILSAKLDSMTSVSDSQIASLKRDLEFLHAKLADSTSAIQVIHTLGCATLNINNLDMNLDSISASSGRLRRRPTFTHCESINQSRRFV